MSDEIKPVLTEVLVPVHPILDRPEDDWCATCAKPSLMTGPMVKLSMTGVEPWGTVTGCPDCKTWQYKDNDGKVVPNVKTLD